MIHFFFSCNFFQFLTLINPGSGSVFSLKCWIRIRIKWLRIQNPGREEEGCRCCTWSRVSFFGDSSRMGGWAARLGGAYRLAQFLTGRAQPLHKNTWVKGQKKFFGWCIKFLKETGVQKEVRVDVRSCSTVWRKRGRCELVEPGYRYRTG
jgi:hypothetical protein